MFVLVLIHVVDLFESLPFTFNDIKVLPGGREGKSLCIEKFFPRPESLHSVFPMRNLVSALAQLLNGTDDLLRVLEVYLFNLESLLGNFIVELLELFSKSLSEFTEDFVVESLVLIADFSLGQFHLNHNGPEFTRGILIDV